MTDKEFKTFKRNLKKKTVYEIRAKEFNKVDGAYLRRIFLYPRNVKVKGSTITFDIENWVTLKPMTISYDRTEIELFAFGPDKS